MFSLSRLYGTLDESPAWPMLNLPITCQHPPGLRQQDPSGAEELCTLDTHGLHLTEPESPAAGRHGGLADGLPEKLLRLELLETA